MDFLTMWGIFALQEGKTNVVETELGMWFRLKFEVDHSLLTTS